MVNLLVVMDLNKHSHNSENDIILFIKNKQKINKMLRRVVRPIIERKCVCSKRFVGTTLKPQKQNFTEEEIKILKTFCKFTSSEPESYEYDSKKNILIYHQHTPFFLVDVHIC